MTRWLHLYWKSFKFFLNGKSQLQWIMSYYFTGRKQWSTSLTYSPSGKNADLEKRDYWFSLSLIGWKTCWKKLCFTLKMYLFRVIQLLVNVSLEAEICPCCCVLLEQAVFKKERAMQIENFLPPLYSFLCFFQKVKKQFFWGLFLSKYLNIPKWSKVIHIYWWLWVNK